MSVTEAPSTSQRNDPTAPSGSPSRRRRLWPILVGLGVVIAGTVWYLATSGEVEEPATEPTETLSYAEVVSTDLVETADYEGTMSRLGGDTVSVRTEGTITALPEEGSVVEQGEAVAWVNNQPIILLYGDLPAWRVMAVDTEGPDVLQLETALTALGYNADGSTLTVDEEYTSATENVVEDWEEAIGADVDGVVTLGQVMFASGPISVGEHQAEVGDVVSPGTPLYTKTGDDIEVTFGLPTQEQGQVNVGDQVEITLPDLSRTTGVVATIDSVATLPEGGGAPYFETTVTLDDPSVAEGIDEAPVTIEVIIDRRDDVVAVPIEALLALAEGGYAVEVDTGTGTTLVAVEPGFYANGLVEVTGDIQPGDMVVVP